MPEKSVSANIKLSGFTFLRNGSRLGYPFIQSIQSALPICDEFVIALGQGQDNSRELIEALNEPKIKIIDTFWNESMRDRGFVYGQQKMIAHYCCSGDWAFYLEGDEVLSERDVFGIRANIEAHHDDPRVEAFAFHYHHFFGSPSWLAIGPGWYRTAVRIVRNTVRSYSPDGLFFTVSDGNHKKARYPRAVVLPQHVYHYGHVRPTGQMREKLKAVGKYWNHSHEFDKYRIDPRLLTPFEGQHPLVVADWLAQHAQSQFEPDVNHQPNRKERRQLLKMRAERLFGIELSRRHYTSVPPRVDLTQAALVPAPEVGR